MTDLWYIKRNDLLRFETLKCPENVLNFTKNFVLKFHYFVLGPLLLLQVAEYSGVVDVQVTTMAMLTGCK